MRASSHFDCVLTAGKAMAAAAAVALLVSMAACSKDVKDNADEGGKENPVPQKTSCPIAMSAFAAGGESTKSPVTSEDDLKKISFGVYAHDTIKGTPKVDVFTNQKVSYSTTESKWTYSPEKYWNEDADYYFAAYSPWMSVTQSASDPYVSQTYGSKTATLVLHNIPYWQPASTGVDFMYSKQKGKGSTYVSSGGTVGITFTHLLSRLIVRAYYSGEVSNVCVNSLVFGSSASGEGVPSADGKVSSWSMVYTDTDDPDGIVAGLGTSKILLSGASVTLGMDSSRPDTLADFFVAPFPTLAGGSDKPLTVTYENNSVSSTPASVGSGITKMQAGKIYVLTLNIVTHVDGSYVYADGVEEKQWNEQSASGNLYNW